MKGAWKCNPPVPNPTTPIRNGGLISVVTGEDDESLVEQLGDGVLDALAALTAVLDAAVRHVVGPEGRGDVDQDAAGFGVLAKASAEPRSLVKMAVFRP